MTEPIHLPLEIPLSKKKLMMFFCVSILFVIIGFFLLFSERIKGVLAGLLAVFFFGGAMIFLNKKLKDKTPGLTINEDGIIDNSSGVAAGLILWSDIVKVEVLKIASNKFIMLHVKDPEQYISKQKGVISKKLMQTNWKLYGSPISISTNGLETNFDYVFAIIHQKYSEKEAERYNDKPL